MYAELEDLCFSKYRIQSNAKAGTLTNFTVFQFCLAIKDLDVVGMAGRWEISCVFIVNDGLSDVHILNNMNQIYFGNTEVFIS